MFKKMNKVNILGFCALDVWDSVYVIKKNRFLRIRTVIFTGHIESRKAVNWTLTPNQGPLGVSNEPI